MIVYVGLTVIVMLVALLMKKYPARAGFDNRNVYVYTGITKRSMLNKICMLIIFIALFAVSALRLNVGNDYSKYVEFMHLTWSNAYVPTEIGFNLLTKAVYTVFGFENYIFVFAVFAFATVAFFLAALWEQSDDFYVSFAMFMLLGYYFQSLSTVRYYLALAMAIFSLKYLFKRDFPKFIVLVLFGACFHKSLLLILIMYPVCLMKWKKWMYGAIGLICLSCVFLQDLYLKIALKLYPTYEDTSYVSDDNISIISIARCVLVVVYALYIFKKSGNVEEKDRFYFHCNLGALLLYTFGSFMPTVSRIGYYLTVTQILLVPSLIKKTENEKLYKLLRIALFVGCIGYFCIYMKRASGNGVRLLPYETFLFHELPPTLSERGFG
ncbi:MAG: EpsG family protein [Butyrivibrio sp.]|nr:EpsG family protein [Butyrivibrio sp.]